MPAAGFRTVAIHDEVYRRMVQYVQEHKEELREQKIDSLSSFLDHLIMYVIEADDVLRRRAPWMRLVGFTEQGVVIEDKKIGRIVEVRLVNDAKDLWCELDQRNDCVHVGFAYAIPEVYHAMMLRGGRPPHIWE
jgi:predicted transcriptional regulator